MSNIQLLEHYISLFEKSWDNKKLSDMELSDFIIQTDTHLSSIEGLNRIQDVLLNMLEARVIQTRSLESEKGD